MNGHETTILEKLLKYAGHGLEIVSGAGFIYNAVYQSPDSLRRVYFAAGIGAIGVIPDKFRGRILRYVDEMKQIKQWEQIQQELAEKDARLEELVRRESIRAGGIR